MRKIVRFTVIAYLLMVICTPAFSAMRASDFLASSPAMAETEADREKAREVQEPDKIVQGSIGETQSIWAPDMKDAINAILKYRNMGAWGIASPQGIGVVATGLAIYDKFDNEIATRISKQQAYARAYIEAKKVLTEWIDGVELEAKTNAGNWATSQVDASNTSTNLREEWSNFVSAGVNGVVRRHSVYDVFEDAATSRVYVTIVSAPALWGEINRPASSTISAESLQSGLDSVFAEINNGIVFPVGGKAIYVPQIGEMAFIGYASSVIRASNNSAIQARQTLNAERIARSSALVSLNNIIQENESLKGHEQLDEFTRRVVEEMLKESEADVTERVDQAGYDEVKPVRDLFRNSQEFQFYMNAVSQGKTPPGIQSRSWIDNDKGLAWAVAVYIPSYFSGVTGN